MFKVFLGFYHIQKRNGLVPAVFSSAFISHLEFQLLCLSCLLVLLIVLCFLRVSLQCVAHLPPHPFVGFLPLSPTFLQYVVLGSGVASCQEGLWFKSRLGLFCIEVACSPYACVCSHWVFWYPPKVQKCVFRSFWIWIGCQYECETPVNRLAPCPQCTLHLNLWYPSPPAPWIRGRHGCIERNYDYTHYWLEVVTTGI